MTRPTALPAAARARVRLRHWVFLYRPAPYPPSHARWSIEAAGYTIGFYDISLHVEVCRHTGHSRGRPCLRQSGQLDRADLEHLAIVASLPGDAKLSSSVQLRHDGHHGDDWLAPAVVECGPDGCLFAEPDQVAGGRKRQFKPAALAARQGLARRNPDRVGRFLAVMGAGLLGRSGGEKEPGVEPLRHALRRDPVRIRHQLIEREQQTIFPENLREGGLALAQSRAMG